MQLSETIKLKLNKEEYGLLVTCMDLYINAVNDVTVYAVEGNDISKFSSKNINVNLPSALRGQIALDAKSIVKKYTKKCREAEIKNNKIKQLQQLECHKNKKLELVIPKLSVIHKLCLYVNNQNFTINSDRSISIPFMIDGKCKRVRLQTYMTDRQWNIFQSVEHFGTLRIVMKNRKIVAQVIYDVPDMICKSGGNIMGIDLGIKCPAVSYVSDNKITFYGNGRRNKYIRRHYAYLRKRLQKKKKLKAIEKINDKEQRIMKDTDHQISASIIKEAVKHNVSVIKMEQLSNIRSTTRKSRKNNHSLHNWSFYRLQKYIEYKANRVGIEVLYVNPAYTSQKCPNCGHIHKASDRKYRCQCGYKQHRDAVGAINICCSTEYVGDSDIRHTA